MPIISDDAEAFMLTAVHSRGGFKAEAISRCRFVLAKGFRNEHEACDFEKALAPLNGKLPALRGLYFGRIPRSERKRAFFIGRDYWLSKRWLRLFVNRDSKPGGK